MYEKNRIASFSGLGRYYGQADAATQEIESALPVSVAVDTKEVKQQIIDPQKYIPKKTPVLDWFQAGKYLKRPIGSAPRVTPVDKIKGDVYWTSSGPKFSKQAITDANKAEKVSAPEIVWKPNITVVRDKPKISLPQIEIPNEESFKGLGEWSSPRLILPVLGLIIVVFLLYKR